MPPLVVDGSIDDVEELSFDTKKVDAPPLIRRSVTATAAVNLALGITTNIVSVIK
jgi:hypothetical protein